MTAKPYDLVVLGGGPGGYTAAIRARQLGLRTALIERENLGGICLNWGCIPTKALLRASEIHHLLQNLDEFGFHATGIGFDFDKVIKRSRRVAKRLAAGVRHLMKKNGVDVFEGSGKRTGQNRIEVSKGGAATAELTAPHLLLATGARSSAPPALQPDGKLLWGYREAMIPDRLPGAVLIIGAGAIGIEFASFYRNMGSEVTVVELLPRILPAEDEEISELARKELEKQGIQIRTEAKVDSLEKSKNDVTAVIDLGGGTQSPITVDRVIVATGIIGNTEDLGLEGTGVRVDRGHVVVNEWSETGEPGIYAIGDLAGPPWLAHKASHEGVVCVEKIAGVPGLQPLDLGRVPACTYSRPQVASVGQTEARARAGGREIRVGRYPARANGKAFAIGEVEGLVKTIFDAASGELLGAHMIGAEVTELIQGFAVAINLETTEAELMRSVFPHPTLSEMMHESVLDAYGRALNF